MKHTMATILFLSILVICTVSNAIVTPSGAGKYDQLTQDVLGPDPLAAAEAIVAILNNEETLLATAEVILKGIDSAPAEIAIKPFLDLDRLPLWVLVSDYNPSRNSDRANIANTFLCDAIREATPSKIRNALRSDILDYFIQRYNVTLNVSYHKYAFRLFFWRQQITPESDCKKLAGFLLHIAVNRGYHSQLTEGEKFILIDTVVYYAFHKIESSSQREFVSMYASILDKDTPGKSDTLACFNRLSKYPVKTTEAEYKSLFKKTPEQLIELMSNPCGWYFNPLDYCIAQLLAGTPKLRQQNFQLLLPSIKNGCLGRCNSFVSRYSQPILKDADEAQRKQKDILLDLLEEKIKNEKNVYALWKLNGMLFKDDKITDSYGYERIKEINIWCRKSGDRDLMETASHRFPPE